MAKKQIPEEPQVVRVGLRLFPYYAIDFDHPALSGHTAIGATPEKALASARAELRRKFPVGQFVLEVYPQNPETFERAGLEVEA